MASFFIGTFTTGLGGSELSALAAAFGAFDIVEFQVDNLMDDDTANTTWPQRIWWSVLYSIIGRSVGDSLVIL